MNYEFRNNLLQTNEEFKTIFNKLKSENKITDYTREIWSIIEKETLNDILRKNIDLHTYYDNMVIEPIRKK